MFVSNRICRYYHLIKSISYKEKFLHCGRGVNLLLPVYFANPQNIELGDGVRIGHNSRLCTYEQRYNQSFKPYLKIGTNVTMEDGCHIGCINKVVIEDEVMIAGNIFIADHDHGYSNVDLPYRYQDLTFGEIHIGYGSWIGDGARIFGKVKIGRQCIIGANSVVTRDIPDYCIAAGVPARILKVWDFEKKKWKKILHTNNLYKYRKSSKSNLSV
jgi:acetyltransferase-like isoleucine patch superfamily enzyme